MPRCHGPALRSGYDVGGELIFDERDAVAQDKFALLQALDLKHVKSRRKVERLDRGIEIAMLLAQAG